MVDGDSTTLMKRRRPRSVQDVLISVAENRRELPQIYSLQAVL
jgi:hypothetical protein